MHDASFSLSALKQHFNFQIHVHILCCREIKKMRLVLNKIKFPCYLLTLIILLSAAEDTEKSLCRQFDEIRRKENLCVLPRENADSDRDGNGIPDLFSSGEKHT